MGFDAGDERNYYAHPWSQTDNVLKLANQEFLYAIRCGVVDQSNSRPLFCPRKHVPRPSTVLGGIYCTAINLIG